MSAKKWLLLWAGVAMFLSGFVLQFVDLPGTLPNACFYLLQTMLVFAWFRLDAQQYAYRRSSVLNAGVIFITLPVLTYYFFRTRGAVLGSVASLLLVVVLIGYAAMVLVGAFTAFVVLGWGQDASWGGV